MTYLVPQLPGVGGSVTLQSTWRFSTNTAATDPGNKTLKYDDAVPADVTELYINDTTNENGDASTILGLLVAGNRIYIQQQDDASRATLYELTGPPVDNTGWWTIPVLVVSSLSLPQNNKTTFLPENLPRNGPAIAAVVAAQAGSTANFISLKRTPIASRISLSLIVTSSSTC